MTIIAITGLKSSGKTTLGKHLEDNYCFKRVPMAEPLKTMLKAVGLTEDQINGDAKEARCDLLCGRSPRYAMQTLGTEWGRILVGNNIWVNLWRKRVAELSKEGHNIVVDDIRYPDEIKAAKSLGAITVAIKRHNVKANKDDHSSEVYANVMGTDFVICNDGSFEELFDEFARVVLPSTKFRCSKK